MTAASTISPDCPCANSNRDGGRQRFERLTDGYRRITDVSVRGAQGGLSVCRCVRITGANGQLEWHKPSHADTSRTGRKPPTDQKVGGSSPSERTPPSALCLDTAASPRKRCADQRSASAAPHERSTPGRVVVSTRRRECQRGARLKRPARDASSRAHPETSRAAPRGELGAECGLRSS